MTAPKVPSLSFHDIRLDGENGDYLVISSQQTTDKSALSDIASFDSSTAQDCSKETYAQFCLNVQSGVAKDPFETKETETPLLTTKGPYQHFILSAIIADHSIALDSSCKEQAQAAQFLANYADKQIMKLNDIGDEFRKLFLMLLDGPMNTLEDLLDAFNDDFYNDFDHRTYALYYQRPSILAAYPQETQVALGLLYHNVKALVAKDSYIASNISNSRYEIALRLTTLNLIVKALQWQVQHLSEQAQSDALDDNLAKLVKELKKAAPTWFKIA